MKRASVGVGSNFRYAKSSGIIYTDRRVSPKEFFLRDITHQTMEGRPLPWLSLTARQAWREYRKNDQEVFTYPSDTRLAEELSKMVSTICEREKKQLIFVFFSGLRPPEYLASFVELKGASTRFYVNTMGFRKNKWHRVP